MTTPLLSGNRLRWFDATIPVVASSPIYTDEHRRQNPQQYGFHAVLPTENGTNVMVTVDPEADEPEMVSQWLYVKHPETGRRVPAKIVDGQVEHCRCESYCQPGCWHDDGWWEYVSSPQRLMANLAWLGSLQIRVTDGGDR